MHSGVGSSDPPKFMRNLTELAAAVRNPKGNGFWDYQSKWHLENVYLSSQYYDTRIKNKAESEIQSQQRKGKLPFLLVYLEYGTGELLQLI